MDLKELERWAERHTSQDDTLVLEASGNAFAVAGRLRALGRRVAILDSDQADQIGKVYCANDRVDAIKIARIYLSGLSTVVSHLKFPRFGGQAGRSYYRRNCHDATNSSYL